MNTTPPELQTAPDSSITAGWYSKVIYLAIAGVTMLRQMIFYHDPLAMSSYSGNVLI